EERPEQFVNDQAGSTARAGKDPALRIDAEKLGTGAARRFFVRDEGLDPSGFDIADADAALPARIPPIVRHTVGDVDVALAVDGNCARLAELRPPRQEISLFVEDLHTLIPTIRDVKPPLGVDFDAVRIVELQRQAAFRADTTAPRLDELAVLRKSHQPIV